MMKMMMMMMMMMMMVPDISRTSCFGIKEFMSYTYTVQDEGSDVEEKSFMRFITVG